jgi:hypothetical protein
MTTLGSIGPGDMRDKRIAMLMQVMEDDTKARALASRERLKLEDSLFEASLELDRLRRLATAVEGLPPARRFEFGGGPVGRVYQAKSDAMQAEQQVAELKAENIRLKETKL